MQTKEYRTVDKSTWGPGEWQSEPDKMQWPDPETGLPCLIVRGPFGALCGYVGVPSTHPWHGKGYSANVGECRDTCEGSKEDGYHYNCTPQAMVEVHGGLTFSDACADTTEESQHICHLPDPGEPDHVWWFGFDCGHSGDACPASDARDRERGWGSMRSGYYKDLAYVKREVTALARQLSDVARS